MNQTIDQLTAGTRYWRQYPMEARRIHRRMLMSAARTVLLFSVVPAFAAVAWMTSGAPKVAAFGFGAILILVSFWATSLAVERIRSFKCRVLVVFDRAWAQTVSSPVFPGIWLKTDILSRDSGLLLAREFRRLDALLISKSEVPLSQFVTALENMAQESVYCDSSGGVQALRRIVEEVSESDELRTPVHFLSTVLASAAEHGVRFALVVIDDYDYVQKLSGRAPP